MKKVIVMGKGKLAIQISEWFIHNNEYDLVCIVPVIPEPTWSDSFTHWAIGKNIEYVKSGNYMEINGIEKDDFKIDLVFSVFYDKIISKKFIQKCEKILNIHNGPLPKYRGVRPINWALKNNEINHGVTIHEITQGIDDGPIIAQVNFSIYPSFDEVEDVYNRALEFGWILFQQTIPILYKINGRIQNNSESSYYGKKDIFMLGDRETHQRNLK